MPVGRYPSGPDSRAAPSPRGQGASSEEVGASVPPAPPEQHPRDCLHRPLQPPGILPLSCPRILPRAPKTPSIDSLGGWKRLPSPLVPLPPSVLRPPSDYDADDVPNGGRSILQSQASPLPPNSDFDFRCRRCDRSKPESLSDTHCCGAAAMLRWLCTFGVARPPRVPTNGRHRPQPRHTVPRHVDDFLTRPWNCLLT